MGVIDKIKSQSIDENKKTVFDYDITDEEWKRISTISKDWYLENCSEDDFNWDIATLLWERGETDRAKKIAERLPCNDRNDWLRLMTHP